MNMAMDDAWRHLEQWALARDGRLLRSKDAFYYEIQGGSVWLSVADTSGGSGRHAHPEFRFLIRRTFTEDDFRAISRREDDCHETLEFRTRSITELDFALSAILACPGWSVAPTIPPVSVGS